jgi:hypothetical protein
MPVGRVPLMTIGSAAGFTWAGATDEAVRAAITVKADRNVTNIQTVTWAVNRPVGALRKAAAAEGGSPTAWHLNYGLHADMRMPPAWSLVMVISDWFLGVNPEKPFQR